jgi:hypothetical protein
MELDPQGADPHPPPLRVGKAGRNHLNEEITPLLPTGIGERYSQTMHVKLRTSSDLNSSYCIKESAKLTWGPSS